MSAANHFNSTTEVTLPNWKRLKNPVMCFAIVSLISRVMLVGPFGLHVKWSYKMIKIKYTLSPLPLWSTFFSQVACKIINLFNIINYLDIELMGILHIFSSGATVSLAITRICEKFHEMYILSFFMDKLRCSERYHLFKWTTTIAQCCERISKNGIQYDRRA